MAFLRKNFAFGTLAANINDIVVQLTMTAGHTLPTSAGTFRLTIWDSVAYPDPAELSDHDRPLSARHPGADGEGDQSGRIPGTRPSFKASLALGEGH